MPHIDIRNSIRQLTLTFDQNAHDVAENIPDQRLRDLVERYVREFQLESEPLKFTTSRREFQQWIGRGLSASAGGAYIYHPRLKAHIVLINLVRIDLDLPRSLEIVVCEEFMHMRDWIDGDRRRHAKHGYDRIAHRVAEMTGTSLEEIRTCLKPVNRRTLRYLYRCPGCGKSVERRKQGTWSCGVCSPKFDQRYVLRLELDRGA